MALILVRGENNTKLLSAIADIEKHGNLNLITKPKVIDSNFADSLVEDIFSLYAAHHSEQRQCFCFLCREVMP